MTRFLISMSLLGAACGASANPTGGSVVAGTATFSVSGSTLTVTNSDRAVINWQGFSIGASEATRFIQGSSSSAVLNRVVSVNPSVIDGNLASNGRVFLVNPNGIVFGAGAQVNVAGLVASSYDISNADFVSGNHGGDRFVYNASAGPIRADVDLAVPDGGTIGLYAPTITAMGLSAPGGTIDIRGDFVTINDAGTPPVIVPPVLIPPGEISLPPGVITLTTGGAVQTGSIVLSGASVALDTRSAFSQPGQISLSAGAGAAAAVTTTVAAAPGAAASVSLNLPKREGGF